MHPGPPCDFAGVNWELGHTVIRPQTDPMLHSVETMPRNDPLTYSVMRWLFLSKVRRLEPAHCERPKSLPSIVRCRDGDTQLMHEPATHTSVRN
jgi:hypothetical protein